LSASSTESEINSPKAKQCKMADEASQPTLEAVYAILMEVQRNTEKIVSDNILMHKDYEELKASLSYQSHLIEKLAKENKDLNTQVEHLTKSLTECKLELKTTATQVEALEDKDDELEMYSRKHNLEIHGVPEDNDDDLDKVVMKLANILGVEANEDDIDIVHRLPSRYKGPRPIIVKFRSHKVKSQIYMARRNLRGITSFESSLNGAKAVYINENLTSTRRKLFAEIRKRAKLNNWYNCWTTDGKIFVRRVKGERAIKINKQSDMEYLYT